MIVLDSVAAGLPASPAFVHADTADLCGFDFMRSNLSEERFVGADLAFANPIVANMTGCIGPMPVCRAQAAPGHIWWVRIWRRHTGAHLYSADLPGANLQRFNRSGADLAGASIAKAAMTSANLAGAIQIHTNFFEANLSGSSLAGGDGPDPTLQTRPVLSTTDWIC